MKVHSNYDDLIAAVGAQAVPKDYGGSGPSVAEGNGKYPMNQVTKLCTTNQHINLLIMDLRL